MIRTIGDSHTMIFKKEPGFDYRESRASTAYGLKSGSESWTHLLKGIRGNSIISYGEIDCRVHIWPQSTWQKITIEKSMDIVLERFEKALEELKKLGYKPKVLSITPAGNDQKESTTPKEIVAKIKKEYNTKLGKLCEKLELQFINIYPEVADEQGFTKPEYKLEGDEIHLNKKVVEIIKKYVS